MQTYVTSRTMMKSTSSSSPTDVPPSCSTALRTTAPLASPKARTLLPLNICRGVPDVGCDPDTPSFADTSCLTDPFPILLGPAWEERPPNIADAVAVRLNGSCRLAPSSAAGTTGANEFVRRTLDMTLRAAPNFCRTGEAGSGKTVFFATSDPLLTFDGLRMTSPSVIW